MEGRMGARNQYPDFMDALSVSQGLALILLLRFESLRMGEIMKNTRMEAAFCCLHSC